jgi:hypothetical protein
MKFNIRSFCLLFSIIFAMPSHSSIYDRIDRCERSGGGACVFTLLRELAGQKPNTNTCVCTTEKANVRSNCFMKEEYSLKIDGRVIQTGCGEDADNAYVNCLNALKKHNLCQ